MTSFGYRYRWSLVVVQPVRISSAIASLQATNTSSPCRRPGAQPGETDFCHSAFIAQACQLTVRCCQAWYKVVSHPKSLLSCPVTRSQSWMTETGHPCALPVLGLLCARAWPYLCYTPCQALKHVMVCVDQTREDNVTWKAQHCVRLLVLLGKLGCLAHPSDVVLRHIHCST